MMSKEQQEKLVKAFIQEKMYNCSVKNESGETINYGECVKRTQNHLSQIGIWEESKEILKQYILTCFHYLGDEETEFFNGELKRVRK